MYSRNKYDKKCEYSIPPRYDGNAFRRYNQSSRMTNGVDEVKAAWERRAKEDIIIPEHEQASEITEPQEETCGITDVCAGCEDDSTESLNEPSAECGEGSEKTHFSSVFDALSGIFEKISCEELLIGAIILVLAGENKNGECTSAILALVILLAVR